MPFTQQQAIALLSLLSEGKLISELTELLSLDTDNNFVAINSGSNDAKKIKIPLLRGYKGTYNASTNTPNLSNTVGLNGDMYVVSVAGSRDFGAGTVNLLVDDIIIYLNSKYIKINGLINEDFTIFGNKNSVYELAEDTKMTYKKGETEEEIISALNSTSQGGFHGLRYVEKYKTIYAADRGTISGQVEIYIFNDLDDLTNYSTVTITTGDTSFSGSDQIIYSSYKDKLYIVPNDTGYTTTYLQVWELNPSNNTVVKVIDLDVSSTVDYPFFCSATIIDNHFFVSSGVYTTALFKFDLNDYTLSDSLEISPTGNQIPHALTTDGEKIWATSSSGVSVESSYIARVNPTNMSLEDIQYTAATNASVGGGITDDILLVGDYLYLPLENFTISGILKVHKNDLTDQTVLQVPLNAANDRLYAIYFDGVNVWYAGQNDSFGKIDIKTHETWLYENPFSYSINEIQSDGQRMFVTGFDVYPVNNTGYVGRTLFPTKPIKKVILKSDGSVAQEIDYSTGNTTVEGVVEITAESGTSPMLILKNTSTSSSEDSFIAFQRDDGTGGWSVGNDSTNNNFQISKSPTGVASNAVVYITPSQNVGVGIDPSEKLDVDGTTKTINLIVTNDVGIGTTTPNSKLHLIKSKNSTNNEIGTFIDVEQESSATGSNYNYAQIVRSLFSGSGTIGDVWGAQFIARANGSGNVNQLIGFYSLADLEGTADATTVISNYSLSEIKGTGSSTLDDVLGVWAKLEIENANTNITDAYASYSNIDIEAGTVGNLILQMLDYDFSSANQSNVSVNNLYYIKAKNDTIPNVSGNAYFIFSESTLNSYLEGNLGVGTDNPTEKLEVKGRIYINPDAQTIGGEQASAIIFKSKNAPGTATAQARIYSYNAIQGEAFIDFQVETSSGNFDTGLRLSTASGKVSAIVPSDLQIAEELSFSGGARAYSDLPSSPSKGMISYIKDASSISYRGIAAGGGSDAALVFYDGSNWIYH